MMNSLRVLAPFVSFLLLLAAPAVLVPVSVSASTVIFDSDKVGVKASALTKSLILSEQPVSGEDISSLETGAWISPLLKRVLRCDTSFGFT